MYVVLPIQGLLFDILKRRFKAGNCVFIVPKNITTFTFRSCFLNNTHEIDERRLIAAFIRPEDTVLELGGCIGVVSCITNKLLADQNRHVVVEANPYCLPALYRNRNLNQCSFLVENCAVSSRKDVTFYINPDYITGGTAQKESKFPVRMPGRSLNELFDRHGSFSVLIMDIEGGELEVLETSQDVIQNFHLIIIELHEWAIGNVGVERCRTILELSGFKLKQSSYITEAWTKE